MNKALYTRILYFIVTVILIVIGVQMFWNYKQYESEKQQLIRDMQTSLDLAVSNYYSGLVSKNNKCYVNEKTIFLENDFKKLGDDHFSAESIFGSKTIDSTFFPTNDSLNAIIVFKNDTVISSNPARQIKMDSLRFEAISNLTSEIMMSLAVDSINIKKLDTLVRQELSRKRIKNLNHFLTVSDITQKQDTLHEASVQSRSELLPLHKEVVLSFDNIAITVLKRNMFALLLSLIFVVAVISLLLYLLYVINKQKALDIIKNDFISNITHEFKTPIATISAAIESVRFFNTDPQKTANYLDITAQQATRLSIMVEKLLETATLDSNDLELHLEHIDLGQLCSRIVASQKLNCGGKAIVFEISSTRNFMVNGDVFHLENAVTNIIENAIKYGGEEINIKISDNNGFVNIAVADGGYALSKKYLPHIFDKFYRIPTGNTHNVKGFGIGLFYSKAIVEQLGGTITVALKPTVFNITLPYV